MSALIVRQINTLLRGAALRHKAVFVPSEEPQLTDDEVEIRLMGQPTRFVVQISSGEFCVNEHTFDAEGEINGVIDRGAFRSGSAAARKVVALLKADVAGEGK